MPAKKATLAATEQSSDSDEATKAELQRRMEEARESISQTVEEIKDTVTEQYQAVKETVSETLDWREYYRKNPIAWSVGALSVGFVVGYSIAGALKDSKDYTEVLSEVSALKDRLIDEAADISQTVLLPALVGKIKDLTGFDLTDKLLAPATTKKISRKSSAKKSGAKRKATRKKTAKKTGAKKSTTKRSSAKRSGSRRSSR